MKSKKAITTLVALVAMGLFVVSYPVQVGADIHTWQNTQYSSEWNAWFFGYYNWSPNSLPAANDIANIGSTSISGSQTANYNYDGSGRTLGAVNITGRDNTRTATLNLQSQTLQSATVTLNAYGYLNQTGGTLNAGTITLNTGGTFAKTGGTLKVSTLFDQSGGTSSFDVLTVDGAGTANNTVKTYTLSGGTMTVPTLILTGGTFTQNGGTLDASVTQSGGTVAGTLDVQSGKTFAYNSGTFSGQLVSRGIATFNANFLAGNGMINYSTLSVPTGRTITLNGAGLANYNPGTVNLSGGTLAGTAVVINSGTLSGAGTINAPVTIGADGIFNPGASPGIVTINSNYTQSGTLNVELQSLSSFDQLIISGWANLTGGTINVSLLPGFTTKLGDTYKILSYTNLLGSHPIINLPDPDGAGPLWFNVDYLSDGLQIRTAPIPASLILLATGLLGLVGVRRFRR